MPVTAAARTARTRPALRDVMSSDDRLPHWSEVTPSRRAHEAPPRVRPPRTVAVILADLVSWAADLAIARAGSCPEDRAEIEDVRRYALAWLAGEPAPDVRIEDVLTTVAAVCSAIDLDHRRASSSESREVRALAA